jgi:hypothetical protein
MSGLRKRDLHALWIGALLLGLALLFHVVWVVALVLAALGVVALLIPGLIRLCTPPQRRDHF